MKIIHTADWHLGKMLEGRSRREEQEEFLRFFIEETGRYDPNLILIAGDIYDGGNPPAWAEQAFYESLKALSGDGRRMILVIAGNHDSPERLEAVAPLAREHGILICGLPRTVIDPGDCGANQVLNSGEGWLEVLVSGERAVILTAAYPSERRLNEIYTDWDADESEQAADYAAKMKHFLEEGASHFREDTVNLMISHLFTMGTVPSGSERSIQLGGSYLLDGSIMPEQAQYIALGHVHRPQVVPGTHGRAWYAGAPMAYHSKEAGSEMKQVVRSFYRLELTPGQKAEPEPVIIPCSRPVIRVVCSSVREAEEWCQAHSQEKAWVYLDVETDRYIHEEEIRRMRQWQDGLLEVRPLFTAEIREVEAAKQEERTFEEEFTEFYLRRTGVRPDRELMDLLFDVLEGDAKDETTETDH